MAASSTSVSVLLVRNPSVSVTMPCEQTLGQRTAQGNAVGLGQIDQHLAGWRRTRLHPVDPAEVRVGHVVVDDQQRNVAVNLGAEDRAHAIRAGRVPDR